MSKKVVILTFSPRKSGNCGKIADFIGDFHMRTNVQMFEITAKNYLPCNGCDYECLNRAACPAATAYQKQVMDAVMDSDLTYYIVPNFCGWPNANFFAFNERSVGYFAMDRSKLQQYMSVPKKFVIVSNTESDTFYNAMKQQTSAQPKLMYLKTGKYAKRSTAGDLMESEDARNDLLAYLKEE